ncbi:MAG: hypothetical protein HYV29_11115 [Ignavibacteriales bacterium]|nr:hypothetical protein [Ignavibacteriales bacterium]
MKKSASKILSVILLLSYLIVSTGRPMQLLGMLCGFGMPVLIESKPLPFSANNGRSFKPSFKHFPPQTPHPYSPVDSPGTIKITPVHPVRIIKVFHDTDYFQSLLLYSDGLRGPPGNIFS